jgi:hypothetical protein
VEVLRRVIRRGLACLALTGLCILATSSAWGAPSEDEVKAAYLYNFARYVTWPDSAFPSADAPIRICVVGDSGFRSVLASTVAEKRVGERPVSAESRGSAGAADDCHILYLGKAGVGVVSGLSTSSIFTVSDSEGFAAAGGIANFVLVGSKVRFEINTGAVEKAGLQVSSRLLRLAQIVE